MTKEEADFIGGMNMCDEISNEAYKKIMCHCEEQEPKTGTWRKDIDNSRRWDRVRFYCSECGSWQTYGETDYCPKCGAKMEEREKK